MNIDKRTYIQREREREREGERETHVFAHVIKKGTLCVINIKKVLTYVKMFMDIINLFMETEH